MTRNSASKGCFVHGVSAQASQPPVPSVDKAVAPGPVLSDERAPARGTANGKWMIAGQVSESLPVEFVAHECATVGDADSTKTMPAMSHALRAISPLPISPANSFIVNQILDTGTHLQYRHHNRDRRLMNHRYERSGRKKQTFSRVIGSS